MTSNNTTEVIDLRIIARKILTEKRLFYKTLPAAFVLSCALILCVPRYYVTDTSMAPEVGGTGMEGTLGSIASSFGFDLSDMQTSDAISPLLYPDLMDDNGFVAGLFDVKVKSQDGDIATTYYDYISKHQKTAWWNIPISWVRELFSDKSAVANKGNKQFNPYSLSKRQDDVIQAMRGNITISVDKKTAVITISVKAQDALICKTMADSIREHLQNFITTYRTNKSRIDMIYYEKLVAEAKNDYENARRLYGKYADANTNVTLESFRLKINDLENDMQLKYNTYSTLNTQLQAAKAKVQERTPAFTTIKGASVPIKPAGPKRMLFVLGMMVLTFFCTSLYAVKDDIKVILNPGKAQK